MQKQTIRTAITQPASQIEIQTEGGIQTAYMVQITIPSQKPNLSNYLYVDHYGSPSVAWTGDGFSVKRSAGPNKYGEQNFRVSLAGAPPAHVRVVAQSSGDRSNAQMALRWGHPDFNNKSYFHLWTIKAGAPQEQTFDLTDVKSEFEIQTEGGEGTGYHFMAYIDVGKGMPAQPSIEISHKTPHTDFSNGFTDVSFSEPNGNIYGEMDIDVNAPWIVAPPSPAPSVGGLNLVYDYGTADPIPPTSSATIRFMGTYITGSGGSIVSGAKTSFSQDVPEVVNGGQDNRYSFHVDGLQPGNWAIQVSPVFGGHLGVTSGCNTAINAGSAKIVTVSAATQTCQ